MPAPFDVLEAQAHALKHEILALAARDGTDSAVLVAALADVLGTAAAVLDKHCGQQNIKDRLHLFEQRALATYERVRHRMETMAPGGKR